jgi:hypothetical protein
MDERLMKGKKQEDEHIDLGLAISGATLRYGETRTTEEISFYCNCSRPMVDKWYHSGLKKLRNMQIFRKDPILMELLLDSRGLFQKDEGHEFHHALINNPKRQAVNESIKNFA